MAGTQGFGFGYGNVWQPNQQDMSGQAQGGILGSSGWAGDVGLLGAALKDAGASFSGRPADATSLQEFAAQLNQRQQRAQLMAALTSGDPDMRQKAYMQAAMLGIDTKPFQQQQSNAGLPGLLDNMQNGQSLQVPQVTGNLPGLGQIQGGGFNMQTGPLSAKDALQFAPPELQQQYAPKVFDEALKPRDGAPHEGVNPKTGKLGQYTLDNGVPNWLDVGVLPKAPTTRTIRQGTQQISQEFDQSTGQWRQVGTGDAFKPDKVVAPPGSIGIPNPAFKFRSRR